MANEPDVIRGSGTIQAYRLGDEAVEQMPVAGLRFAGVEPGREHALAQAMGVDTGVVRGRLEHAGSAAVAIDRAKIAAYGWVLYGRISIPDLRLEIALPADHAYIWDCLTLPAYRGRGVFPGLLRYLLEDMRGRGIRLAWAATAPGNSASVRAFAKAGFRLVALTGGDIGSFSARPTQAATADEAALLRERLHSTRP